MAKNQRGRKSSNQYFGRVEEEAVVRYLECNDESERNTIYNQYLRKPLDKMVESIVRKYGLHRNGVSFKNHHDDILGHLITKAEKFNKESGNRAYSYYGTIIKNYALGAIIKDDNFIKKVSSYEDLSTDYLEDRDDLKYEIHNNSFISDEFFNKLTESIRNEIEGDSMTSKKKLTDNEKKVGYALIDILTTWNEGNYELGEGTKFNKNYILESMRNYTGLTTKDIRLAMKRFKDVYGIIKIQSIDKGFE